MSKQFRLAYLRSLNAKTANSWKYIKVLFYPKIEPYQMLPFRARVDPGMIAMKGFSVFQKAPVIMEPHNQIVLSHIQDPPSEESYPFCRDAVSGFYSPNWLGNGQLRIEWKPNMVTMATSSLKDSSFKP